MGFILLVGHRENNPAHLKKTPVFKNLPLESQEEAPCFSSGLLFLTECITLNVHDKIKA